MAQSTQLLAAYLIVGPNEVKARRAVARLRARVDESLQMFNINEVTASSSLEIAPLVEIMRTFPVGAPQRIVIVHQADQLAKPAAQELVSYLKNPAPTCVLALVASEFDKRTALYKAIAGTNPKAVIACDPIAGKGVRAADAEAALVALARNHGLTLGPGAASELRDRVGDDARMLNNALGTLAQILTDSYVEVPHVREHIERVGQTTPWGYLDALCARNAERALSELALLLTHGGDTPVSLLFKVVGRMRELMCAQSLRARGTSHDIAQELRLPPNQTWRVRTISQNAARFSPGELGVALAACARTERALKTGEDPLLALTRLTAVICGCA